MASIIQKIQTIIYPNQEIISNGRSRLMIRAVAMPVCSVFQLLATPIRNRYHHRPLSYIRRVHDVFVFLLQKLPTTKDTSCAIIYMKKYNLARRLVNENFRNDILYSDDNRPILLRLSSSNQFQESED